MCKYQHFVAKNSAFTMHLQYENIPAKVRLGPAKVRKGQDNKSTPKIIIIRIIIGIFFHFRNPVFHLRSQFSILGSQLIYIFILAPSFSFSLPVFHLGVRLFHFGV